MKNIQIKDGAAGPPMVEVLKQAKRRRYSTSYKLKIVEEADRLCLPGQ